ncbi:gliding motility-associated C-terminal domain-containing protein [Myroides sp. LJL116]
MYTPNKKYSFIFLACLPFAMFGQSTDKKEVFTNEGVITVAEGGLMSTIYPFDNTQQGNVKNDGTVYFYHDFNNDNIYTHSTNAQNSTAIFTPYEQNTGTQLISGESISEFHHVILKNPTPVMAFDLKNAMDVNGSVDFQDGIIQVDSLNGSLTFHHSAQALNPTDRSHAEGMVEKIGQAAFQYPKGDKGLYRYSAISAPNSKTDAYEGTYILEDKAFFRARPYVSGVINILDKNEYWIVEKGSSNHKEDILLTLSWDERTTPAELLKDPEKELHIVRFDPYENLWVDEGGIVDLANKEITTPTAVKGYGFFTLATVKTDLILDGDVVIYNLVTPNGDGKNDYFEIENLHKFPDNRVEIFNRWGVKVFETSNYDAKGDGSVNVFRGYSEGRVTVDKNQMLPTGTYYYVLTYEYTGTNGNSTIKKAGYLHLETH